MKQESLSEAFTEDITSSFGHNLKKLTDNRGQY